MDDDGNGPQKIPVKDGIVDLKIVEQEAHGASNLNPDPNNLRPHPRKDICSGILPLRIACILIAIFGIVVGGLVILLGLQFDFYPYPPGTSESDRKGKKSWQAAVLIFYPTGLILQHLSLLIGVWREYRCVVVMWNTLSAIQMTTVTLICLIYWPGLYKLVVIPVVLGVYLVLVVFCYTNELDFKRYQGQASQEALRLNSQSPPRSVAPPIMIQQYLSDRSKATADSVGQMEASKSDLSSLSKTLTSEPLVERPGLAMSHAASL